MSRATYDLAVIGAGAAGLTAAGAAAAIGAKTILIEAAQFGGDCTWRGCIPSKALLRAAGAAAEARGAHRFGIEATPHVDGERVLARLRAVRERIYAHADAPPVLAGYGIETLAARARFADARTLALDGTSRTITARRFVIATGSRPASLELGVPTVDPDTIWDIETLPERLLVIGGGPVAIELAQAFQRLGVAVTLVVASERILERDDPAAAAVIASALRADGVELRTACRVTSATHDGVRITAILSHGIRVAADLVLVAVGRVARVEDLGLEAAGVALRDGIVAVDARCRTSARHIYAAGDCATTARFTHVAERMAAVAIANAIVGLRARFDPDAIAWTTFTDPELAHVGPAYARHTRAKPEQVVHAFPCSALDRAIVDDATGGFAAIVTTRGGRVLGGTVVGSRAGETIAEIALARAKRLRVTDIAATMHAYPSYAMGVRRAADLALVRKRTRLVLLALRLLRRLRGTPPPLDVLLP